MVRLAYYNKLPPKPHYLTAVLKALAGEETMSLIKIAKTSGLTQTQAACALEKLIAEGAVRSINKTGRRVFSAIK